MGTNILGWHPDDLDLFLYPEIYTPEELKSKYSHREHFVRRVLERPKIMLLGTENDLAKLVGEPMAGRA